MLSRHEFKTLVLAHCRKEGYGYDETLAFVKQAQSFPLDALKTLGSETWGLAKKIGLKGFEWLALPLLFAGPYVLGRLAAWPTYTVLNKGNAPSAEELQQAELLRTLQEQTEYLKRRQKEREERQKEKKAPPPRSVSSFV